MRGLVALFCVLLLGCPGPQGEESLVASFDPNRDAAIQTSEVTVSGNAWHIAPSGEGTVALFEVAEPGLESAQLMYRGELRAQELAGNCYLEMWVQLPGAGRFFSKGLDQVLRGTSEWAHQEIRFFLRAGQRPERISLGIYCDGSGGRVELRNASLAWAPFGN